MKKAEDGFWLVSWMTDASGRCVYLAPFWQRLTGQSNKAALGCGWLDAICPDHREKVKNELVEANRGETPLRLEFRLRRADGAFSWVMAVGGPRYDEAGVFQGFVGSITNIDDRIRTDQRLMEVQHRLQAVMNAAPVGLSCSNSPDCQHITGNPTLFSQFEISPKDNVSASASDPEAAGRRIRFFRAGRELIHEQLPLQTAVRERREIAPMELEVLLPSGRRWYADVSGAPVLGRDGEVLGGVAVTVDITARRNAEEALRESEARFASFMRHLPGLAWIKNVDGRYVFVNDSAEKAFRMPRAELYGKTDEEIFPSDTAAQFRANDQKARASEAGFTTIETLEHEDGVLHHSLVSKFRMCDAAENLTGVGGIAIDVTERVIAEQKLLEATERLREADKRKDEFLAMLAHELRNPLAPIRNGLQVLRRAAGQTAEPNAYKT
jgi:PAS domain S-box-containing protein